MSVIFIGFGSPVVGNTEVLYDFELVKRDLLNHFNTRKGERIMDMEYGCIAWDLIFDLDNDNNISALDTDIRRIVSGEPRVELVNITINRIAHGYEAIVDLKYVYLDSVEQLYIKFDRENREDVTGAISL